MHDPKRSPGTATPTVYLVLCTVPDAGTGSELAGSLVRRRLAACVNRVPGVTSIYRWQGEVHEDAEQLLLIKTDANRLARVVAAIEAEHPYECPEAIAVAVAGGSLPYLSWIRDCLE